MTPHIPEFGHASSAANYVLRPGGYAVIFNQAGEVAAVSTPGGLFLPGGGQDSGESAEDAAVREVREECGLQIKLHAFVGAADELIFAADEGVHYRKRCSFYLAEIIGEVDGGESDHQLVWVPTEVAKTSLRHESQRWAISEACRLRKR